MEEARGTTRLAAAAFGVLLLATVGAFFLANQLKSKPPSVNVIRRDTFFSPGHDGRRDTDTVIFTVGLTDHAAVDIVDADGAAVRRLSQHKRLVKSRRTRVTWNGRDDDGKIVPDGEYRMRLILDEGRSLLAPKPFYVDTVPPNPAVIVAPGSPIVGPGTPVPFRVRGAGADEAPAFKVIRTDVTPEQVVKSIPGTIGKETYSWDGTVDSGGPAPPGTYLIQVTAYDKARNQGQGPRLPLPPGPVEGRPGVTVRELAIQPPVRSIQAGDPFQVRVDARKRAFSWTLRRLGEKKPALHGLEKAGGTSLLIDAPRGPSGIYLLRAESHGHDTTVPIVVHARTRVGPLIVLPMITWLGIDPVDQTLDGVPDTFASGNLVRFPRLFSFPDGTPPGLFQEIAPLLTFLDDQGIRYDLTTDLDLAFGSAPTEDQKGVIMLGEPTWVSRPLSRRLRDYVTAGGKLALFGPRALRATVTVGDSVLSRPSPITPVDALGARFDEVHPFTGDLSVLDEDQSLGLLEGFSGTLGGFKAIEEQVAPGKAKVVTSVGLPNDKLRPAFSASSLGQGYVFRIGLPEWMIRLGAGDPAVEQLTRNLTDILRGVKPKPRTASG